MFVVLVCQRDLVSSHLDEGSKRFVDSNVISEDLGHIWLNLDKVGSSAIALGILASDAALHLGEIVLRTKVVCGGIILLHNLVARVVLRGAH